MKNTSLDMRNYVLTAILLLKGYYLIIDNILIALFDLYKKLYMINIWV